MHGLMWISGEYRATMLSLQGLYDFVVHARQTCTVVVIGKGFVIFFYIHSSSFCFFFCVFVFILFETRSHYAALVGLILYIEQCSSRSTCPCFTSLGIKGSHHLCLSFFFFFKTFLKCSPDRPQPPKYTGVTVPCY